jgi:hypothetical protein
VLFLAEIGEEDAVVFRVRETLVMAAGAGELGVEIDAVAHVADDEKRRATLGDGERGDVATALVKGALEGAVEGGGAALAVAGFGGKRAWRPVIAATFGDALFGFEDEVAGLVEVDVVGDGGAVGVHAGDGAIEDVEVLRGIGRGGIGAGDADDVAEFREEHLVVRALGGPGVFPTGDEGVDGIRRHAADSSGWWRLGKLNFPDWMPQNQFDQNRAASKINADPFPNIHPMILKQNTCRPSASRIRPALGLLLIALSVGCASKSTWNGQFQADRKERLTRGCVFYFDGAGGGTKKSNYAEGVVEGMLEADYRGAGELVSWETGKGLMKDQDASVAYKRAKADEAATSIRSYQKKYPGAPVGLLGFSAGTAEAIFALEVLPETAAVDHVVLLGTSISRDYDMTEALKRVKNKLYIFTSTHDQMLGTLMPLSGTADRKFNDPGAGIKGFVLPAGASAATRKLYTDKIVTIPYSDDFRKDKDKGHHFDNVKKEFIRDQVAPLLIGKPAQSS